MAVLIDLESGALRDVMHGSTHLSQVDPILSIHSQELVQASDRADCALSLWIASSKRLRSTTQRCLIT